MRSAIFLAVVGTIIISIPLERLLFRRIYGSPELTQVLMTIGITFCVIGITNYFFGPTLKTIPLPAAWRSRSMWASAPSRRTGSS